MGYKNTGRGEICALIINSATMIIKSRIGIIHIFFDFPASTASCFNEENIVKV